MMRRALAISEKSFGSDHPNVPTDLNNLAVLLTETNRHAEAEPLYHRALAIDEKCFGPDHPRVANRLNNFAQLLQDSHRLDEAEPLIRRLVAIFIDFERKNAHPHPHREQAIANYAGLLAAMGKSEAEIRAAIASVTGEGNPRDAH
jgi:tetratricopeptide (TPR) repeat protein